MTHGAVFLILILRIEYLKSSHGLHEDNHLGEVASHHSKSFLDFLYLFLQLQNKSGSAWNVQK